jgi:inhibitor of cysteine peptidase
MKKYLGIAALALVTVLAVGLVAGCGGSGTTPTTPTSKVKTYTKADKNITAKAGDTFIITLESNPTTGYEWSITGPLSPAIQNTGSKYIPGPNAKKLEGAGGVQNFTVKAVSKGSALIQMEYLLAGSNTNGGNANFNVTVN